MAGTDRADFDFAKATHHTIKLLGVSRRDGDDIEAFVSPMLVPTSMEIAHVGGPTNIIKVGQRVDAGYCIAHKAVPLC